MTGGSLSNVDGLLRRQAVEHPESTALVDGDDAGELAGAGPPGRAAGTRARRARTGRRAPGGDRLGQPCGVRGLLPRRAARRAWSPYRSTRRRDPVRSRGCSPTAVLGSASPTRASVASVRAAVREPGLAAGSPGGHRWDAGPDRRQRSGTATCRPTGGRVVSPRDPESLAHPRLHLGHQRQTAGRPCSATARCWRTSSRPRATTPPPVRHGDVVLGRAADVPHLRSERGAGSGTADRGDPRARRPVRPRGDAGTGRARAGDLPADRAAGGHRLALGSPRSRRGCRR